MTTTVEKDVPTGSGADLRAGDSTASLPLEINGDLDAAMSPVNALSDLVVQGTVRDMAEATSAASIRVQGGVEAATLRAGSDVHVDGGVSGRAKGQITAGGEIHLKFCNEAQLRSGKDIHILREAMGSDIYAMGRFVVKDGSVIGGRAYAREGSEIRVLGSEAGIRTQIAVGVDPVVLAEVRQTEKTVKKKQEASAQIREKVQPLMNMLKRLSPQQRERATELMYEADRMDAEIAEQERSKAASLAEKSPSGEAVLSVTGKAFPGVTVIFGDLMTTFQKPREGPFRLARQMINRTEAIVLVDPETGAATPLPSYEYTPGMDVPAASA